MKVENRWNKIRELLKQTGYISVPDLAVALNVSEVTVRRDLVKMEEQDMLERLWGGARLKHSDFTDENINFDDRFLLKYALNLDIKAKIVEKAASLIEDGDCIFLDAGSTTNLMIDYITASDIIVVSNGLPQIIKLISRKINTYALNGFINMGASAIMSEDTPNQLTTFNFNKVFLGTNAIHESIGYSTRNSIDATIKKSAIANTETSYILSDSTKFNVKRAFSFASLDEITLITNEKPPFDIPSDRLIIV